MKRSCAVCLPHKQNIYFNDHGISYDVTVGCNDIDARVHLAIRPQRKNSTSSRHGPCRHRGFGHSCNGGSKQRARQKCREIFDNPCGASWQHVEPHTKTRTSCSPLRLLITSAVGPMMRLPLPTSSPCRCSIRKSPMGSGISTLA